MLLLALQAQRKAPFIHSIEQKASVKRSQQLNKVSDDYRSLYTENLVHLWLSVRLEGLGEFTA